MNTKAETTSRANFRTIAKRFLIIFLPLAALISAMTIFLHYTYVRTERIIYKTSEVHNVDHQEQAIVGDFKAIVSDLMFLSEHPVLQGVLQGNEPHSKELLAREYLAFSKRKRLYDQIRFIDNAGMEIIRINFNDGKPGIVPDDQLQLKAKRYYFEDTLRLGREEVYVSSFDLNIERGEIEQPLKPMIRFGAPVFDENGQKRGIIVLNYLGAKLIHNLQRVSEPSWGQVLLLNSDGFYLRGYKPEDEWGFMYEDGGHRTFAQAYPEEWQQFLESESGQFVTANGMFTFKTVYSGATVKSATQGAAVKASVSPGKAFEPSVKSLEAEEYHWTIVSHISPNLLNAGSPEFRQRLLQAYAGILMLVALGAWLLALAITSRKRAEKEIKERSTQLEDANKELEAFSYSVSHDLRAPLRSMDGFSQALLEDCTDKLEEQSKKYLHQIRSASRRMTQLIDDLLKLSRLTRREMEYEATDLSALANAIAKELQETEPERKAEFIIKSGLIANGDEHLLRVAMENLLGNAWKFTGKHDSARIELGTSEENGKTAFFVRDDGAGFDMKYADKLFGAFQRLHSTGEFEGTGIGLATVQRIIHRHGGRVWAESEVERGSTFYFTV